MLELVYDIALPACQQQHCRPDCQALRLRANQLTTFSGLPATSTLRDALNLSGATLCHVLPACGQAALACQQPGNPQDKRKLAQYLLQARTGRHWFRRPQAIDHEAVSHVLQGLSLASLRTTPLQALNAEQRLMADIAHALVQAAPVVLLDLRQLAANSTLRRHVLRYLAKRAIYGRTILCALGRRSDSEGLSHWHVLLDDARQAAHTRPQACAA